MSDHGNPTMTQLNLMLPLAQEHLKSVTEWYEFAKGVGNEREGVDLGQWDTDRWQSVVIRKSVKNGSEIIMSKLI
jgi:hypothetical protein